MLLAFLLAIIIVCQIKTLHMGAISDGNEYISVMSDIEGIDEANPRVIDLGMLGAHDASTYNLTKYVGMSGEVNRGAAVLYKCAWGLTYRYSKTQVSTIYDQLEQGVRYVHIKSSYFDGKWCGSHSLIDGPLDVYIKDVIRFLQDADGEIVVVHLLIKYGGDATVTKFLSEIFDIEYNGLKFKDLVPYEDIPLGELRYNDVTQTGTRGGQYYCSNAREICAMTIDFLTSRIVPILANAMASR